MKVLVDKREPIRRYANMRLQAVTMALEARKKGEKEVASYWFRKARFWRRQLQEITA